MVLCSVADTAGSFKAIQYSYKIMLYTHQMTNIFFVFACDCHFTNNENKKIIKKRIHFIILVLNPPRNAVVN